MEMSRQKKKPIHRIALRGYRDVVGLEGRVARADQAGHDLPVAIQARGPEVVLAVLL